MADPRGFRTWLLAIAQNVAIDAARRELRQKRSWLRRTDAASLERVASSTPRPDEEAEKSELRGHVLAALRSLPEEYRLPLTLRYISGSEFLGA